MPNTLPSEARTDIDKPAIMLGKMVTGIKSKYVIDDKGKAVSVLVDMKTYRKILAELEELESIRAYDAAKVSGEKAIKFDKVLAERDKSRQ